MNSLPNELLLKIFGKVDWYYQIYHPLNLICKKWNDLIKKHGIDFDTDYNTQITIYEPRNEISIEIKGERTLYFSGKIKFLESILLKIPTHYIIISSYFEFSPELIKFYNKHVKKIHFLNSYYKETLNNFTQLLLPNIPPKRNTYNFKLKRIRFERVFIKDFHKVLNYLNYYPNIKNIEFAECAFLDKNEFLKNFDKKIQNANKITFINCSFNEFLGIKKRRILINYVELNLIGDKWKRKLKFKNSVFDDLSECSLKFND